MPSQGALRRLAELMRRVNSSTDTEVILEEIAHGVVDVLGYGVAAFGVGPLENLAGLALGRIFAFAAIPALILALLAMLLGRRS